jgi:hypothetical protein
MGGRHGALRGNQEATMKCFWCQDDKDLVSVYEDGLYLCPCCIQNQKVDLIRFLNRLIKFDLKFNRPESDTNNSGENK